MRVVQIATALLVAGGQPAIAQTCATYEGQSVLPISSDTLISTVSSMPGEKDEFETSEQFNARVQSSLEDLQEAYVVKTTFDPEQVVYDADRQRFSIKSYALDNMNASWEAVFGYGRPLSGRVTFRSHSNIDVVVSSSERITGTYQATNAFGASATISQIRRVTVGIFDRKALDGESLFFRSREDGLAANQVVGTIPAEPAIAREMKGTMRAAVVIAPKAPWYGRGEKQWGRPTISDPREITETVTAVIADIQCALVLDSSNRVLLSLPTR